jgi:hypothetical protein
VAWTVDPVRPDAVLHASEDPAIEAFVPHVPATNPGQPAMVWTIERRYSPLYLFPRDCPRVAVWANDRTQRQTLSKRFGATTDRVQFAAARDQDWVGRTTIH